MGAAIGVCSLSYSEDGKELVGATFRRLAVAGLGTGVSLITDTSCLLSCLFGLLRLGGEIREGASSSGSVDETLLERFWGVDFWAGSSVSFTVEDTCLESGAWGRGVMADLCCREGVCFDAGITGFSKTARASAMSLVSGGLSSSSLSKALSS